MARTAKQLIQELGYRLGDFIPFTATGTGTATTVVSTGLQAYLPKTVTQQAGWIYPLTGTVSNIGQEARATSWTYEQATVTLLGAGLPSATATADTFEMHLRTRRSRKLEAINSAVGQLGLYWGRYVVDTSLTTAQNQWTYTLPAGITEVHKVEIQIATTEPMLSGGYPYDDAQYLNWAVRRSVSALGIEAMVLQFGIQPPPSRILRVYAEGWFSDLAADADVLGIGGQWERPAFDWILDFSKFRVNDETAERQPGGEADKYRTRAAELFERQKQRLIDTMQTHRPGKLAVPGMGDGERMRLDPGSGWAYLGALANQH